MSGSHQAGSRGPSDVEPQHLRGWITPAIRSLLHLVTWPSDAILGSRLPLQAKEMDLHETSRRARRVDTLVACAFAGEVIAYAFMMLSPPWLQLCIAAVLAWRVTDIFATSLRVSLFDRFEAKPTASPVVASHVRIVILGLINYAELLLCFAGIYAAASCSLKPPATLPKDWLVPLYFSAVTQFTIGYGDVVPVAFVRGIVIVQGVASLLLLILIVGRFVSLLRPERALDESTGKVDGKDRPLD